MGVAVLTDVRGYFGGLDATSQNTEVQLDGSLIDLDSTTMGSGGWTGVTGGLKSGKLSYKGFATAGAVAGLDQVDDRYWADLIGGVSVPVTLVPTSGAVGAGCVVGKLLDTEYKRFGKVGDLDPFELTGKTDGPMTGGFLLHPTGIARTTTGNGTGLQYPAIAAGHSMLIGFHALSVAGTTPSLAVIVQSAAANTFASPTTRATFSTVTTTTGGQFQIVPGPVTDTWWRVVYTIAGTTPSYLFAVSAGIL